MGRLVTATLIILATLHLMFFLGGMSLLFTRTKPGDGYFPLSMGIGFIFCFVALYWQFSGKQPGTRVKLPTQFGLVVLILTMALFGLMTGAFMALRVENPDEYHHVAAAITGFIYAGCGMAIWYIRRRLVRTAKSAIAEVF